MITRAHTVTFEGMEPREVDVECAISPGLPGFAIVGLPDKAVSEARERIRAVLNGLSLALPAKKITINLTPADLPKTGSHFDLAIALALLAALEIAAAGRHHMMMVGPPGSGKSMLAARLPGILPPLSPVEALETSMVYSLAGLTQDGGISRQRPFREPHHTASTAAIVGGGRSAKPGEISLAHNGVLFMDEFPEFPSNLLETLRQPIETGSVMIARANAHVKYPCRFMLIAAANPCKCGHLSDPNRACGRAPICGADYLGRISGPLMDRFDLRLDVPPVSFHDLDLPASGESSAVVAARVNAARARQTERYEIHAMIRTNADAGGEALDAALQLAPDAQQLLRTVADRFQLSARGYHRVRRVARTIADLAASDQVCKSHLAEAVSYRLGPQGGPQSNQKSAPKWHQPRAEAPDIGARHAANLARRHS